MNTRVLLLLVGVAAAATPGVGQTVAPAAGPASSGKQGAASIPDFSGIWAHPYLTGFEPPISGPGPVRNKSRLPNGVANFRRLIGDHTNPILKPHAAERVKQHGEISRAGGGYPTPSNQCWPGGVPYVFWDFLVQMFQEPDQTRLPKKEWSVHGEYDGKKSDLVINQHFISCCFKQNYWV
jgi:hypothetical protein